VPANDDGHSQFVIEAKQTCFFIPRGYAPKILDLADQRTDNLRVLFAKLSVCLNKAVVDFRVIAA